LRIGSIDPYSQTQERQADYGGDSEKKYPEPLDVTRIHPADYNDTKLIIAKACEKSGDLKDMSVVEMTHLVRSMLLDPDKALNADGVIQDRQDNETLKRHQGNLMRVNAKQNADQFQIDNGLDYCPEKSVEYILDELKRRVPENRQIEFKQLSPLEKFYLYTSMTAKTLRQGKELHARVVSVENSGDSYGDKVKVRLECGISGWVNGLNDKVREDEIIEVIVKELKYDRFGFGEFVAKGSFQPPLLYPLYTFETIKMNWAGIVDYGTNIELLAPPMPTELKEERDKLKEAQSKKGKTRYIRRQIAHEAFKNLEGGDEAEKYLEEKPVGEKILRPSSKGKRFLTLTWKVAENIYAHNEIEQKTSNTGEKILVVVGWGEEYSEIDELLDRYYVPVSDNVNMLQRHGKYKEGDRHSALSYLRECHKENPKRKHYIIRAMNKHPGFFEIIHTQSFSKNLPFRITPDGYKLFGKEYPEVKNMIGYFKRAMQKGTLERDRADYQKKKKAATEALKKAHADKLENRRLAKMKQQQQQNFAGGYNTGGGNQGNYGGGNQGNYGGGNQGNYGSGNQGNYGSGNQGNYGGGNAYGGAPQGGNDWTNRYLNQSTNDGGGGGGGYQQQSNNGQPSLGNNPPQQQGWGNPPQQQGRRDNKPAWMMNQS
jgi:transcription elongation factor SPT6